MRKTIKYENFPVRTVFISNMVSLSIYGCGFFILFRFSMILSLLYLLFILIFEIRLIGKHCINCYYWGKTCGFGKGRLSSFLFKKGIADAFCKKTMKWKDMIPDLLISFIPFIAGIVLLADEFDYQILISLLILIALTTAGNGFVRGSLTCRCCKQKDLGCPADRLFNR